MRRACSVGKMIVASRSSFLSLGFDSVTEMAAFSRRSARPSTESISCWFR
jgi:hypothetical protein